jgi:Family of unknown function (DUF6282)
MRSLLMLFVSAGVSFAQLQGVVDIHTHADPDSAPRSIDVLDLARIGKDAGMRALVLKNHYAPTVQIAYLVAKLVPGIEIFGAIALDRAVGGVNPEAVIQGAAIHGKKLKIVWMPTFDSENEVHFLKQNRPFASIARNGKLLPETIEVLNLIKKENLVLATGHSSGPENLLLVREGKKLGIAHMVVTHPLRASTHMTLPEMQEAAKMGAYIELCGNAVLPTNPEDGRIPVEQYVKTIRALGPEHIILSSDLGQKVNPVHTEGWKQYLDIMRKAGISNADLDVMAKKNPAELLGLK